MNLVKEQQQFVDEVLSENFSVVFGIAVPGSGKSTTTLKALWEYHKKFPDHKILVTAFNKNTIANLEAKGPKSKNIAYKNTYATGNKICQKYFWKNRTSKGGVNFGKSGEDKLGYILYDVLQNYFEKEALWAEKKRFAQLWSFSDINLVHNFRTFEAMCQKYGLDYAESDWNIVERLRERSHNYFLYNCGLTFQEMIYLPWELEMDVFPLNFGNKKYPNVFDEFDAVFADEVQDFSAAQVETILSLEPDRIFLVGDPKQAIQNFAGSLADSVQHIIDVLGKEEQYGEIKFIDIPVSFRLPQIICDFVNSLTYTINGKKYTVNGKVKASDDKSGNIEKIPMHDITRYIDPENTLIIGRNMAGARSDLLATIFALISEGIKFKIQGLDVSELLKPLTNTMRRLNLALSQTDFAIEVILQDAEKADEYIDLKELEENLRLIERFIVLIGDRVFDVDSLEEYVDNNLSDNSAGVLVSTIHSIKGEEADTVIVLNWNRFPYLRGGENKYQIQAEMNLINVATTRPKQNLYLGVE